MGEINLTWNGESLFKYQSKGRRHKEKIDRFDYSQVKNDVQILKHQSKN